MRGEDPPGRTLGVPVGLGLTGEEGSSDGWPAPGSSSDGVPAPGTAETGPWKVEREDASMSSRR